MLLKDVIKIKNDCCRRIFNRKNELQREGIDVETLMRDVRNCINNLSASTSMDRDTLNLLVQRVEKALPDQTLFIKQFRSCAYGLHDHITTHVSLT